MRLEAIAIRLEAVASRLEAIATRVDIATRFFEVSFKHLYFDSKVSELRKRSRSASALQQEAEELRAVRQCVREWSKNYGECETKKDKG